MNCKTTHSFNIKAPSSFQRGAALLLMAFILGLGAVAYMFKAFDAANLQAKQVVKTNLALNEAKTALMAWAVSHPQVPGMMPFPDRAGGGGYDGKSDCYTGTFDYKFLIGQLPILGQTNPCVDPQVGLGGDWRDAQGNRLWYAVSRNLVREYQAPSFNPIISPALLTKTTDWITVLDRNGNLISDRVAAVIIAPGAPLGNQDRSSVLPPPTPEQYLDRIVRASDSQPFKNYGYPSNVFDDNQFIMGEDERNVSDSDNTFQKPYYFNDKLVYITIDELMYGVEKRALQEAKSTLNDYYQTKGYYPFAAGFGSVANPNQCTKGNLRGLLPVVASSEHVCSCTSTRACNCNFSVVSNIAFTRTNGNFVATGSAANAPTGACLVAASDRKTCTCTGEGSCKRASGAVQFSCNACGSCSATVAGINRFSTTGSFSVSTGGCSNTTNQATCSNNTSGTFTLAACDASQVITSLPAAGGQLPAWYLQNEWQKYITYAVSSNCVSGSTCSSSTSPPKITVGVNNKVGALVATSLANPNGFCDISSYLSAAENTNVIVSNGWQDYVYSHTQLKTSTNTDQVVVVSP